MCFSDYDWNKMNEYHEPQFTVDHLARIKVLSQHNDELLAKLKEHEDRYQPPAETVLGWLASNLGSRALAPLTGSDTRALRAAVQIVEQYSYDRDPSLLHAFAAVVRRMQSHTQELAFHAIAHPMDWSDRARIWRAAGLEIKPFRKCSFEPGGKHIDLAESDKHHVFLDYQIAFRIVV